MRRAVFDTTVLISGVVRDPGDDMILACAVDGQADTIVSRDKDLLSLGSFQGISIMTPETFQKHLRAPDASEAIP